VIDRQSLRLFLDAGVVLQGCLGDWGAAKAVLILAATARDRYTIVLAETVAREVEIARGRIGDPAARAAARASYRGWLRRVSLERRPAPTVEEIRAYLPTLLPILRHADDLPTAVAALLARPDWVLATNQAHWTTALEPILGARVGHPGTFLRELTARW